MTHTSRQLKRSRMPLVQVSQIVQYTWVLSNRLTVSLEVHYIDLIKPDKCRKEPHVGFCYLFIRTEVPFISEGNKKGFTKKLTMVI